MAINAASSWADPEGAGRVRKTGPAPGKSKIYMLFCNAGRDPLENPKPTKPAASMTGHHQPVSETPFKWRFAIGQMMVPAFSDIWIFSPPYIYIEKKKSEFSCISSDKTFWIRTCSYVIRNRDSSPTGQFTDTHFEDSSPTELKTVRRQN